MSLCTLLGGVTQVMLVYMHAWSNRAAGVHSGGILRHLEWRWGGYEP